MSDFAKLSIQVASAIVDRYAEIDHGDKQLACTAGLLLYLNADADTRRTLRRWAQDVAEGFEPTEAVPNAVLAALRRTWDAKDAPGKGRKR